MQDWPVDVDETAEKKAVRKRKPRGKLKLVKG
jgi:hypothetical protein